MTLTGNSRILALLIFLIIAGSHVCIRAADFLVTNSLDIADPNPGDGICGDSSGCTLRAAIDEANALAGPDTIDFSPGLAQLQLILGPLQLSDSGTIVRGRVNETIIDGLLNPYGTPIMRLASGGAVSGIQLRRSRSHGIEITGSANRIGGNLLSERVVIGGCGLDDDSAAGIWIHGAGARQNVIAGCFVGTTTNGGQSASNPYGIVIGEMANNNRIGGLTSAGVNLLSGNLQYGLRLTTGANGNQILNSVVGCDITGARLLPNLKGGLLIDKGAHNNQIGGALLSGRNLISGNTGAGITISGSETDSNSISGNLIGLDATGTLALGNTGAGVLITDNAHHTIVGDSVMFPANVITGNGGDGIRLSGAGCSENIVIGNFIGVDTSGYASIGNGQISGHGVAITDGASRNRIGGVGEHAGNVISGNWGSGVLISAASRNELLGNFIGVSVGSISSAPNASGVTMRNGSTLNTIGSTLPGSRNVISGNRAAIFPLGTGVSILGQGTDYNQIIGNMIGADITGSRALRNGSCGVLIGDGAQYNTVGGSTAAERNIISGNGFGTPTIVLGSGVHLFGLGTSHNDIRGNYIGIGIDGTTVVANLSNGIGLYDGASYNIIGGDSAGDGNLITQNPAFGVYLSDTSTVSNTLRQNRIYDNDSAAIVIKRGAQHGVQLPVIKRARPDSVFGESAALGGCIDIYLAANDRFDWGGSTSMIGSGTVDSSGRFSLLISGVNIGDTITALVTDLSGSTSGFAKNFVVQDPTFAEDASDHFNLPAATVLSQNYPNPFNMSTVIPFSLPHTTSIELAIYDLLGRRVAVLAEGRRAAGSYSVHWDGHSDYGSPVASGVYLCRLITDNALLSNKILLLK